MKNLLLRLLAVCILMTAPAAIPVSSANAEMPKKAGHFKSKHFGKKDHMKFKKVKRKKAERTKTKLRADRKPERYDTKKMHSGEPKSYILGIPIKKKGYKPQKFDR